jgi:hypothetical protein
MKTRAYYAGESGVGFKLQFLRTCARNQELKKDRVFGSFLCQF